jgi:molybdenum cofactor guanylyltransferase
MIFKSSFIHPFEMAICGYSGSGKTTLIEQLLIKWKDNFKVGYIKHDAHRFKMDQEGKDTFRQFSQGASPVLIHNQEKWAIQSWGEINQLELKQNFLQSDFVIIEGHKESPAPKMLIVDKHKEILNLLRNGNIEQVEALIVPEHDEVTLYQDFDLPVFQRDDITSISKFILDKFKKLDEKRPLYGLVLMGGESKRMKRDKSALVYHQEPQAQYLYKMLQKYCDGVFVSCREDQKGLEHIKDLPQIHDSMKDKGPTGGILSAMEINPEASWLVVACDLPFISEASIETLLAQRNPYKMATSFRNPTKGWPEPLCTIWEPKARAQLYKYLGMGLNCPRKVLFNSEIKVLEAVEKKALDNANTPEDFRQVYEDLHQGSLS